MSQRFHIVFIISSHRFRTSDFTSFPREARRIFFRSGHLAPGTRLHRAERGENFQHRHHRIHVFPARSAAIFYTASPGTGHRAPGTGHRAERGEKFQHRHHRFHIFPARSATNFTPHHHAPGTERRAPNTGHRAPGSGRADPPPPGTGHRAPGTGRAPAAQRRRHMRGGNFSPGGL